MNEPNRTPLFHRLLVGPLVLERLPEWLTFLLLAGMAIGAARFWPTPLEFWAGLLVLVVSLADWVSLTILPRLGRSYGPIKPPLLALALLRTGLMVLLGVLLPEIWVALSLQLAILALSLYATWIEPFRLAVSYQTLVTPYLQPGEPPLRLLHLGDLHVERVTRREVALNRLVDTLAPDVIVFAGDFISMSYTKDQLAREHVRQVVGEWHAPLGVYCVTGTLLVEVPDDVRAFIEGTDIRWLRDEHVTIDTGNGHVTLAGLDCGFRRDDALPRLRSVHESLPSNGGLSVLVYHTPDLAPEAAGLGFGLYLCGHTHGGQIRLPLFGAVLTASEFGKRFEMGRYRINGMTLYVTRGIGLEGGIAPRARLFCPPEIVLWELRGQ